MDSAESLRVEHLGDGFIRVLSRSGFMDEPNIPDLLNICIESGVRMIACTPTLEMTGLTKEDLVKGVDVGGAGEFLDFALDADISLFI